MDRPELNPLVIFLFYFLRCLVPLGIMLGVSYLLRRFGLIAKPPSPPADWEDDHANNEHTNGGVAHG